MSEQGSGGFGRWIDLIRAELRKALSRRVTKLIGALSLAGVLLFLWSQASHVSSLRSQIASLKENIEGLSTQPPERLFGRSVEEHRKNLEFTIVVTAHSVHKSRRLLHPENSHNVTLGFMGTIPGVGVAVLLASTLFGAEFRWRYWKTALTTEPRRIRVLAAKLVSMWLLLLVALMMLLGISYPANAAFGSIHDVNQPGPQLTDLSTESQQAFDRFFEARTKIDGEPLPKMVGTAWLTLSFYATLAASLVLWIRSSLAGLVGAGIFLLEGFLFARLSFDTPAFAERLPALRVISPSQQIAYLLPNVEPGQLWYETFGLIVKYTGSVSTGITPSIVKQFPPIPDWRAFLVLGLWTLLTVILAAAALRSRDIPA